MKKYRLSAEKLGDILVKEGLITSLQLERALKRQRLTGERLGAVLTQLGWLQEEDIAKVLSRQLHIPYCDLSEVKVNKDTFRLIPKELAERYVVLPLKKEDDHLHVVMADPLDLTAIEALENITKLRIIPYIAPETKIKQVIAHFYTEEASVSDALEGLFQLQQERDKEKGEGELNLEVIKEQVEKAPVVKFVNQLIFNAIRERASDIHIAPREDRMSVRFRIDGVLHEILSPPKEVQHAIISRIKILAGMDIAERRLPQDGRFTVEYEHRNVDLRVSSLPTIFGEKIVIRLLEKDKLLGLEEVGFDERDVEIFKKWIKRSYGMILLTGPTGSGKTTTLYAAINFIKSPEKNIITLEDPVEYQLKDVEQVQINPKIGLTFAAGLRTILRQDPDIILVGEIRDLETAEMAVRSALTGHLVLSTLHANDAVSTVVRLVNMGIEPFLVCASLNLVVAQRLVRKICFDCKEAFTPQPEIMEYMGLDTAKKITLYRGRGCPRCRYTGYLGRTAIYEFLEITPRIKELILKQASLEELRQAAKATGMQTLQESGIKKVMKGITTFEEVMRVV
ncbi:MAG: Flp pilus assembly complex ATPase component TadA [Candidatus Desulfofervidaceae bacterium]|nr:Flp pilus assembly complex ATPase component TadA [Candidatus Desulfofervidaceae bacterium]